MCGHVRGRVRALKRMADDHLDPHVVVDDDAGGGCGGVEIEAGKGIGNPVLAMEVGTHAKRETKDKKKKKKQNKKKTRGGAVESEKMVLHELGYWICTSCAKRGKTVLVTGGAFGIGASAAGIRIGS